MCPLDRVLTYKNLIYLLNLQFSDCFLSLCRVTNVLSTPDLGTVEMRLTDPDFGTFKIADIVAPDEIPDIVSTLLSDLWAVQTAFEFPFKRKRWIIYSRNSTFNFSLCQMDFDELWPV